MDVRYKNTLLVYVREKIIPVKVTEMMYIHAANGLTYIATAGGHEYATQYSMDELEAMLHPDRFFRANRQFIVHREHVRTVEHYFSRRLLVKLHCETPENIIVSKLKASEFLQWMER
jgi:DNA-binding LytR/AlgR family response regulator